jgi:regulatory protein YycI of two-component signal transduction system YycFG
VKPIKEEAQWDKKKILIFSVVFLAIGLFLLYRLIDFNSPEAPPKPPSEIKGLSAESISENVTEVLSDLAQQASDLEIEEVATSSPQVQKIINDLKSLKDLPKSQLKNACENICSGL